MLTGLLIKNIRCLVQTEDVPKLKVCGKKMSELNTVKDAWLYIKDGLISDFGKMSVIRSGEIHFDPDDIAKSSVQIAIDASGSICLCRRVSDRKWLRQVFTAIL